MIVTDFYENCEIFVTGGSGVVGKALLDKLLRSCNPKRVYVLLRPKRDMNADERLEKIRAAKIFRLLKKQKPDALQKLTAIPGDATLPNLGITEEYAKMMENVSCIFHSAATVKFDEPLKVALKLNVAATLEALNFGLTLKKLKLFLHVSTFFSNTYLTYVEPKVYSSPIDWRLGLKILEDNPNEELYDILTKKLIQGFPNTYTFTKNLAESLVNEYRDRLPIAIFRPSIVLFAIEDPEPGFPPSLMGAMGVMTLIGTGLLKTIYISDTIRSDLTPQDCGTKTMLYYGAKSAEVYAKGTPDSAPVYMFSSDKINPFPFKEMGETIQNFKCWEDAAFLKCLLIPYATFTSSRFIYMFRVFTCEIFPALLVDLILMLMGRKPVVMEIMRKIFNSLKVMEPFLFNEYNSPGITHVEEIVRDLKDTEFDISNVVLYSYKKEVLEKNVQNMAFKTREVLLDEDPSTLPKARKILLIKKIIYNAGRALFYFIVLRWIYNALLRWNF